MGDCFFFFVFQSIVSIGASNFVLDLGVLETFWGELSILNINFSSQRLFFWKRFEGSLNWGGHMHFACCGLLCCCVFLMQCCWCFIAGAVWKCWVDTFWNPNDRCEFCFWVEMWAMNKIELWVMRIRALRLKILSLQVGTSLHSEMLQVIFWMARWPQAFQQRLQHRLMRCKVPILDRCEVLVVGAGPAGSMCTVETTCCLLSLWDNFPKKQTDGWN